MDYYKKRQVFSNELADFLTKNRGKKVPLAVLEIRFGLKFGFGKAQLLRTLMPFCELGRVKMSENTLEILDLKEVFDGKED